MNRLFHKGKFYNKNPAHWRHQICRPMRIEARYSPQIQRSDACHSLVNPPSLLPPPHQRGYPGEPKGYPGVPKGFPGGTQEVPRGYHKSTTGVQGGYPQSTTLQKGVKGWGPPPISLYVFFFCISASICICQEIWCLLMLDFQQIGPYADSFY